MEDLEFAAFNVSDVGLEEEEKPVEEGKEVIQGEGVDLQK